MPRYLDIESWNRKEQFYFFREYDYPFFNICADVDVTEVLKYCKRQDISFFQATLFLSLKTANEIEPFRYRIRGDKVLVHEVIHGGSTVLNEDETFSFSYFSYYAGFREFTERATVDLEKKSFDPQDERDDLIHYSIIPWISFTSFSHARKFRKSDSVPKIVFGKYHRQDADTKMPVSVEVHHALMDGIHVGKFFELFQEYLKSPQKVLMS
ncbi:chloramphenicol acetyltransferase [candidate division KSB1 bacterium]|nr:chloramphenicol acetyltransferase [candidate division KSB1 bacterium]NIR69687.1 chloramphenicol acetyltransferase [candidate division KSB1 bacterium]NIS24337.1 chloramphenicol acetyltransferase [candidate division KSB1 bacterium]NIT71265.1 chloramphenicol acetyltransferase [candidate division KSB1 bacterium]NIU24971.1 chloramphenicol acetyltransferase [candidate division KSB1 bacterium]